MKILTTYIRDLDRFRRALKMVRENRSVQVLRITIPEERTPLHDRYILTKGKGWFIGTSLKDVGKKDMVISEIEDVRAFEQRFDSYWRQHDVIVGGKKCSWENL